MIELTLLTGLTILVWLALRRGKPVVLDTPLVIHRVGQYHATLAPQLNGAQTLIEQIAQRFAAQPPISGEAETLCFAAHDPRVHADANQFYLLAVSLRHGLLYFQAIPPQPLLRDADNHRTTLLTFANAVLAEQAPARDNIAAPLLTHIIQAAADTLNVRLSEV